MFNREKFFNEYKKQFGVVNLKQSVVDCIDAIMDEWDKHPEVEVKDLEKKAYMLATVRSEVGSDMVPIVENMNYSAQRIREVWPSRPEAVKYAHNPEALGNSVYANRLGNGPPSSGDGYRYRGRGIGAQFTGREQYTKWGKMLGVDLINNPHLATDLKLGARVLYEGTMKGLFTGVALSNFINEKMTDYINARKVVNNDVQRMGKKIAYDARLFEAALRASYVKALPKEPIEEITPSAQTSADWRTLWESVKSIFKK